MTQRLHSRGKGRSLPAGYQFGDARPDLRSGYGPCSFYRPQNSARFLVDGFPVCESCNHMRHVHMRGDFKQSRYPSPFTDPGSAWRAPHMNAAEQLARRQFITGRDAGKPRLTFHPDAFRLVMDFPEHFREVFGIGTFTKPFTTDRDPGDER